MLISQSDLGTALGVTIEENRIDASNAEEFKATVEALVAAGHAKLVIDMSKVEFIDSRGLGTCIALMKLVEKEGVLGLCGLQHNVLGVFRLTRLDRVFRIFPDLAAAAAAPLTPAPPRA
ncbi:MAG: STAS domain-containing protein [Desulfovibrionaceae bacterium]|nr:STAS domain-containing protein [Desulfovibrionaceae bacterium]MBF0513968.1 STAS domain-containing protein [Desulfovibrionaceae bacterium]